MIDIMRKFSILITVSIVFFGGEAHGQELCTGDISGEDGFCIDSQDPTQVHLCNSNDFEIEEDVGEECSQSTVR